MKMSPSGAVTAAWVLLLTYWWLSAQIAKTPAKQESLLRRWLSYWLPLGIAFLLLGPGEWFAGSVLREAMLSHAPAVRWSGAMLVWAGVALAIWARHSLGRNWSATVQIKQAQSLVTSGPYARIRHPIYTGLLLAFVGNAVVVGDWRALLAVVIVWLSFWNKLRREEQWLVSHFGSDYAAYRRSTGALLPGWRERH